MSGRKKAARAATGAGRAASASTPLKDVIKTLDRVLAESPHAVSLLFERARALDAVGRVSDAEVAYQAVIRENPRHFRALNDLGLLYHRHKLVEEAERCFRLAAHADPTSVIGATNLAYVLLDRGDLYGAKNEFERALALDAEHGPAIKGLIASLERLGLDASHLTVPDQAPAPAKTAPLAEADPFVEYVYDLAANAIVGGENDAVTSFLQKLLGRDRRYLKVLWRLADFASRQHNPQAALAIFEHAAAIDPLNPELLMGIATSHEEMGNFEAANAAWSSDLLRGVVRIFPYTGSGTPVRLLTIASALHSLRYDLFVDPAEIQNTTLYTQAYTPGQKLPDHDVVLVAVADVESDARALEAARDIVARTDAPVLNHPEDVLRTSRIEQSVRLASLENVGTARVASVSRTQLCSAGGPDLVYELAFSFPVLVRSPGFHNGYFFDLVERASDLAGIASKMPTEDLLLISFQDTRSPDGMTRKFRMMSIADRLYPVHLAVSPNWKVHYASSVMQHVPSFREEEAAYLNDPASFLGPAAMRALERVAETTHLDYGGIDFGIDREGCVRVFEANGAMGLFLPDDDPRWDYRRRAISTAIDAAKRMIVERGSSFRRSVTP